MRSVLDGLMKQADRGKLESPDYGSPSRPSDAKMKARSVMELGANADRLGIRHQKR